MPTPKPLTPEQARRTLAHRLGSRVDRIRQLSTRFGVRPYRCFLTWVVYAGGERGEGTETLYARVEVLPTPRVLELTGVGYRPWSGGTFPEGSVRVDRVSTRFTADHLKGLKIPSPDVARCCDPADPTGILLGGTPADPAPDAQKDFFWEIVEDGRGDDPAERQRYRVSGRVFRDAGNAQWAIMLESASDPLDRNAQPKFDQLKVLDADDE